MDDFPAGAPGEEKRKERSIGERVSGRSEGGPSSTNHKTKRNVVWSEIYVSEEGSVCLTIAPSQTSEERVYNSSPKAVSGQRYPCPA